MKLSTRGRYGIHAMYDLACNADAGPQPIKAIAERQTIPEAYLEQLFAVLKRDKLVTSVRGAQGGYMLSRPPGEITVGDVLRSERTRLQYNQREMAQHLGVTYTAYRAWEQGCCCPQPSNWRRLVRHIPALAIFAPDKPPQLHTQPDDGQEAPGRNGSLA